MAATAKGEFVRYELMARVNVALVVHLDEALLAVFLMRFGTATSVRGDNCVVIEKRPQRSCFAVQSIDVEPIDIPNVHFGNGRPT